MKNISTFEKVFSFAAVTISILIFAKALLDVDPNYDVGWYHLPFAARIWGIIPQEAFMSGGSIESRYDGFPLLAHFFQGLLWKVTCRLQATNLVGYLCLISYFFFLHSFFRVPFALSAIAIFTIPAVITHASSSFVDLPGNIGVSVLMMMLYRFFRQSKLPNQKELLFTFLGAAAAANTKPQLQLLIFVLFWVTGIRLLWLYFKHTAPSKRRLWLTVPLAMIASILIFATPIKNVALYQNPFYPIKIEFAGMVLNHKLTPQTYSQGNRPQNWLQSILEINTPDWSADQWNRGDKNYFDRAGGFFGFYVVFNFLLLLGLTIKERVLNKKASNKNSRQAITALVVITSVSLIPANFPQSHELRYFMFWMITLVSLNLSLISDENNRLQVKYFKIPFLIFFIVMCAKIDSYYLIPNFRSLEVYLNGIVNNSILKQISPDQENCVISRFGSPSNSFVPIQHVFYYSSYFHPEIGSDYSIKVSENPQECENIRIIPNEVK
jgi:hypothetical protein